MYSRIAIILFFSSYLFAATPPSADQIKAAGPVIEWLYSSLQDANKPVDPPTNLLEVNTVAQLRTAFNTAQAGSIIKIKSGVYALNQEPLTLKNDSISVFGESGVVVNAAVSKAVFLLRPGSGNYRFAHIKINGGRYGWVFEPSAEPTNLDPQQGQIHDVIIEDCEVDGNGMVESGIRCRNAGVRNLKVINCYFHHTIGTEGTVDIGEWRDKEGFPDDPTLTHPLFHIPASGSYNLLFQKCRFGYAVHQQASGIVTQPCTYNVTLEDCHAWNNGKYGFALKGSKGFKIDRCAAWGNDSTQMYARGFGSDSGSQRKPKWLDDKPYPNDFIITNCTFIAPADQRGGAALNWRNECSLNVFDCFIVGMRESDYGEAGGYAFLLGSAHTRSCVADVRRCTIVGFNDSSAMRFYTGSTPIPIPNTTYTGVDNHFASSSTTPFKYQGKNITTLAGWINQVGVSETNGSFNNFTLGGFDFSNAPLRKKWSDSPPVLARVLK